MTPPPPSFVDEPLVRAPSLNLRPQARHRRLLRARIAAGRDPRRRRRHSVAIDTRVQASSEGSAWRVGGTRSVRHAIPSHSTATGTSAIQPSAAAAPPRYQVPSSRTASSPLLPRAFYPGEITARGRVQGARRRRATRAGMISRRQQQPTQSDSEAGTARIK